MAPEPVPPTADDLEAPPATDAGPAEPTRLGGLKQRAAALTDQGKKLVDDTRATVPPVDIGFEAVERDNHIGGFMLAGAIAFRMFVYVLPLYLLALVIAGALFSLDPSSPRDAAANAGMSKYLTQTIGDAAKTSHKSLWLLIPVTLYAVFSAGMSVHKAIAAAHARAWDLPAAPKRKPHWVALGIFGFSALMLMVARILSIIRHGALIPVSMVLGAVLYLVFWLAASHKLPRAEGTTWMSLLPGAVLAGVGTQCLYLFNVLYLNHKIESASQAYGALGVAASALLWLYLLGRLMVAAPVLNATLWARAHRDATPSDDVAATDAPVANTP